MAIKKKDASLNIMLSSEQKVRWQEYADEKDMTMASFVRNCVEAYIRASERLRKERGNG